MDVLLIDEGEAISKGLDLKEAYTLAAFRRYIERSDARRRFCFDRQLLFIEFEFKPFCSYAPLLGIKTRPTALKWLRGLSEKCLLIELEDPDVHQVFLALAPAAMYEELKGARDAESQNADIQPRPAKSSRDILAYPAFIAELAGDFPGIDIQEQLGNIDSWLESPNGKRRRKSLGDYEKFARNWMRRTLEPKNKRHDQGANFKRLSETRKRVLDSLRGHS